MADREKKFVSLEEALAFHPGWSAEDRRRATEVIRWAGTIEPDLRAFVPPNSTVVALSDSRGTRRICTFRQGYIRGRNSRRPGLPWVIDGSQPMEWEIPLSGRTRRY